jgi:4-hydroxy-2-oxoheptanedioate aldolase
MCRRSRKRATRCRPAAIRGRARRPITSRPDNAATHRAPPRYWGIDQPTYYKRADTWPLNPEGEVLVVIMCEEKRAIRNLPKMIDEVPGIGVVLIGEGDLSQDMGYPRQYEHPEVAAAIDDILAICKDKGMPCGHPHVDANNVEMLVAKGFRWLMPAPSQSFAALQKGLAASGRK